MKIPVLGKKYNNREIQVPEASKVYFCDTVKTSRQFCFGGSTIIKNDCPFALPFSKFGFRFVDR
jgi:hypothetical protein